MTDLQIEPGSSYVLSPPQYGRSFWEYSSFSCLFSIFRLSLICAKGHSKFYFTIKLSFLSDWWQFCLVNVSFDAFLAVEFSPFIWITIATNVWRETYLSSRLKYAVWMLAALILSQIYISIFNSIITVPEYEPPIDKITDLLNAISDDSHYIYMAENFGIFRRAFKRASARNRVFHQIGRHLNRTGAPTFTNDHNLIPTVERNKNVIVLATRRILNALKPLASVAMHIGTEVIVPTSTTIAMAKKSPLLEPFNKM